LAERPWPYGHWLLYNLLYHRVTTNAFLRGLLRRPSGRVSSSTERDCSSAASRVCDRCRQLSLYPIDLTYSKETLNTYHLSAVDGNLLVGSTCMRGSACGNSFSAYRI